jgi:hypothetical protein
MPLPKPRTDEEKDKFLERAMGDSIMVSDYPDNKQRYAVANSLWEKHIKEKAKNSEFLF